MANPTNTCQFIGNLGADPEMRYSPGGKAVTNFRIGVNEKRGGGEREETMWMRVVVWEKTAEACNDFLHKGSKVLVTGKLQIRKYTDKDGIERQSVEVLADQYGGVLFMDPPSHGQPDAASDY